MRFGDILGLGMIFLVIAYVGYHSTKIIKTTADYTLAGNQVGLVKSCFSMAATEFGSSSMIGVMALTYSIGISGVWWDWVAVPAFLLLGFYFAGKIKLPNMVTITDYLQIRYDYKTKLLASVLQIIAITTQISAQFMVCTAALNGLFGLPTEIGLILLFAFVMIYITAGGFMAVTNTDAIQFIMIVLSVIIILPIALYACGGFSHILTTLPKSYISFTQLSPLTLISWGLYSLFSYATSQHYMQRVFAAKNSTIAKQSFLFTGFSYIFFGLIVSIIGLTIYILIPGLDDPNIGYILLLKNYVPQGLAGLILGGLFAAAMSTAASMLMGASTLFLNDIYKPLIAKKQTDTQFLLSSRIITALMCLASIFISLHVKNIVSIMYTGGLFYSTAVFFPLLLGMKWKKGTATGAFYSMIISVCIGVGIELYGSSIAIVSKIPSNIIACLFSLIIFILLSILLPSKTSPSHT